jgi:tetratricopeptide (TPR) repeat protein
VALDLHAPIVASDGPLANPVTANQRVSGTQFSAMCETLEGMKRPQRNLFIIMSLMVMVYLLGTRLPGSVVLYLGIIGLAVVVLLLLWSRDFLIGRYRTRQRRWQEAAERYQKFEARLLNVRWTGLAAVLFLSLYTFDGVAICRNNIAHSLMNLRELDAAEQWLRRALQRDPLYALPYLNLGVVAVLRGDKERAVREFGRAVQLGYSPEGAQRLFRQIVARINETSGKLMD